jgi:hypothetical protein
VNDGTTGLRSSAQIAFPAVIWSHGAEEGAVYAVALHRQPTIDNREGGQWPNRDE